MKINEWIFWIVIKKQALFIFGCVIVLYPSVLSKVIRIIVISKWFKSCTLYICKRHCIKIHWLKIEWFHPHFKYYFYKFIPTGIKWSTSLSKTLTILERPDVIGSDSSEIKKSHPMSALGKTLKINLLKDVDQKIGISMLKE